MSETAIDPVAADGPKLTPALLRPLLPTLGHGTLTVVSPGSRRIEVRGVGDGPVATLVLHRWRGLRRLLLGGDVAGAEAYMDGDWSSPDLAAFIELVARNQPALPGMDGGNKLSRLVNRLRHSRRANTLGGSRRNIEAHYDLGNDFYAAWLDDGMSYSSALFGPDTAGLEMAQTAKQDRVLDLLDVRGEQDVLEIGIGWGGMAERIVRAGGRMTGLTLSPAQLVYAQDRFARAGLAADLRLQDYRHVDGRFDRIVSIEMLEAVGEAWWPTYFRRLRELLADGGRIVLQVITIADERFERYRRSPDFIQRYVFPGGMLPSPGAMRREIGRAGLAIDSVETFGDSYATTLRIWRERFEAAWPSIVESGAGPGFSPRFRRMWEYYLAYCEGGFRAGAVDVGLWRLRSAP